MRYKVVPVTPFQQNCTLVWCPDTMKGAVVDPGGDVERIERAITAAGITVERILLTHGHVDHAAGAPALAKALGVTVDGPQSEDAFWIAGMAQQCEYFGLPPQPGFTPDRWLEEGETIAVGNRTLEVLHCPGHTPGHVVFFDRAARLALVGDVLFQGSIGRTDFPRGDHGTLIASIKEKLFPLGDDVAFISGHGPMSTFGQERRTNPFLR